MSKRARLLLCVAGLFLFCATAGGAVGSHVLGALDAETLHAFGTAVDFQFFHGLGLIGVTLVAERYPLRRGLWLSAWLIVAGVALFCGSIYATTFGAPEALGSAAPLGGMSLIAGWLVFAGAILAHDRPAVAAA